MRERGTGRFIRVIEATHRRMSRRKELIRLGKLWALGNDTKDIAHKMGMHESDVYNHLEVIRLSARRLKGG
jgi:hypothetical protein